jgi:glyoxylase-like metal-dependent hydrolase (beta-lactamase superfamily II)
MTVANDKPSTSRYYRLRQLGDGVYCAVAIPGSGSMGNAGIIDLGDATLVFDTMLTAQAARDLRADAERLTGRSPRYVVNSHFHADHTVGNIAFDDTTIIATASTASLIQTDTGDVLELMRAKGVELDAEARAMAAATQDLVVRRDMEEQNDDNLALVREAHDIRVRLPNITFDKRLTLQGSQRHAQLISWGGGHTPSDAVLYLPAERILFSGDLIFYRCHAWPGSGDPVEWLRILGEMELLDIEMLAPGHGEVTTSAAIAEQRAYLEHLLALALQAETADQAAEMAMPQSYRDYGFASGFSQGMRALFEYQRAHVNAGEQVGRS